MEPRALARGNSIVTYLNLYSYILNLPAMVTKELQIRKFLLQSPKLLIPHQNIGNIFRPRLWFVKF